MRKLLILGLLTIAAHAYTQRDIANAINTVALENNISPKILYTIVRIESNFKPFAIAFLTNKENAQYFKTLQSPNVKISISNYSLNRAKWVVSIHPTNEYYAKEIAKLLLRDGFSIDVGLGQLNAVNFRPDEIDYVFNPLYNLRKCAKVLRTCYEGKNRDLEKTIECYNYGMRDRGSNPYYRRFYEHYMKEFPR